MGPGPSKGPSWPRAGPRLSRRARVPPRPPVQASAVRLTLATARVHVGSVDRTWWLRSTDAAAELPALIAAVDQRLGEMTLRVGLHVDAWDDIPHRIAAPGRAVRLGWFRSMDGRLVTLSLKGKPEVIPPQATAARAAFAATGASMNGGCSKPPVDIDGQIAGGQRGYTGVDGGRLAPVGGDRPHRHQAQAARAVMSVSAVTGRRGEGAS
ncbi:DUF5994 family protein [Nonomuraea sp. NPDC049750]|uniref:DUF5994 family protein n=1 Tax=Nonomuraea sp. NPDC049750 TaxID=3154738 RepID=UPI0033F3ED00